MHNRFFFLFIIFGLLFTSQAFADTTPPVTTFSSFQVPNTTDQNITLTCTDNNTGCKAINYNINNTGWVTNKNGLGLIFATYEDNNVNNPFYWNLISGTLNISVVNTTAMRGNYYLQGVGSPGTQRSQTITLTETTNDYNYIIRSNIVNQTNELIIGNGTTTGTTNGIYDISLRLSKFQINDVDLNASCSAPVNNTNYLIHTRYTNGGASFTYQIDANDGTNICKGSHAVTNTGTPSTITIVSNATMGLDNIVFGNSVNDINYYNFTYSGAGSHSIQYFSTDNSDNNETIKTSTFTTYGTGKFTFIDENTYAPVTTTYTINPSINGITTGNATSLDLNLQGITNQPYSFSFTSTEYGTRFYYTDLNQFSALDFNQLMLQDTNAANNITLNIYNAIGTTLQTGTPVTITKANYLVGRYLTNSDGAITPFLKDLDTNYLFNVEGAYTTSQRPVLVYRPKYDSNFADITGNWQITLTGPNSTNRYTITTNSQIVAILPNTETLYSAKVCMLSGSVCSTNYFSRTYLLGFKGLVGETSIQPYLNLISDSTLRTLKVLDYATNQPYPLAKIVITSKTDLGVTYTIESLYTDSTGTAGVYLTDGQTYTLTANDLTSYTIIPNAATLTYYIYFNFLVLPTNDSNAIDVNTSNDINMAEFFVMRNTLFSCSGTSDCFPSALLAIILTMIILVVATAVTVGNFIGVKGLSLIAFICFTIFFGIGWLPIYIFAFLGSITILMLVVVQ